MTTTQELSLRLWMLTYLNTEDRGIKLRQARGKFIIFSDDDDYDGRDDETNTNSRGSMICMPNGRKSKHNLKKPGTETQPHFTSIIYLEPAVQLFLTLLQVVKRDPSKRSTLLFGPLYKDYYPDFPRVGFYSLILFEGTNSLARNHIKTVTNPSYNSNRTVGIIIADFPVTILLT